MERAYLTKTTNGATMYLANVQDTMTDGQAGVNFCFSFDRDEATIMRISEAVARQPYIERAIGQTVDVHAA